MGAENQGQFQRVLGAKDVLALAFGAMIGWGWVVLAGGWVTSAGAWAPLWRSRLAVWW